jgi:hypothetical protein
MERGTTPTHTFTLPFAADTLKNVRIIYAQGGTRILTKEREACTFSGNNVIVKLSQSETFLFDHNKPVEIQLRALTDEGDALNSKIYTVTAGRCLDTEAIR